MEPITTTIKNNGSAGTIPWLDRTGPRWVDEGGTITVNYEPWTRADNRSRSAMLAGLSNGIFELTLNILTENGVVHVPYNPYLICGMGSGVKKTTETVQPKAAETKQETTIKPDGSSHIVVAGGSELSDMGFKAEAVKPPQADPGPTNKEGFIVTTPVAKNTVVAVAPDPATVVTEPAVEPEPTSEPEPEAAEEVPAAPEAETVEGDAPQKTTRRRRKQS